MLPTITTSPTASLNPSALASSAVAFALALGAAACTGESMDDEPSAMSFEQLRVEDITPNRAVLRFDTSVEATCHAEYGLTTDNFEWSATDPDMEEGEYAFEHQVPLEDLTPGTTYYIRALAETPAGQMAASEVLTFTTLIDPGNDPTADMVNVALLDQGARLSGVSSNWSNVDNDQNFGAHKAIDGLEGTEWSTAGDGDDAWLSIDFGTPRTVSYIAYRSRMMSDGTSIVTRVRFIDEADGDRVLGTFETPDHETRYVFELSQPVTTQFMRFEAVETTGGNTGAREIQFFE